MEVALKPEDDILEQWRRRRRLELVRQRVANMDSGSPGTSQRLVQPQVCDSGLSVCQFNVVFDKCYFQNFSCQCHVERNCDSVGHRLTGL